MNPNYNYTGNVVYSSLDISSTDAKDTSGYESSKSGFSLGTKFEQYEDIFILMLTAKGEEVDRIVGFELGADDYLVKPFSLRELSLRVSSLLKRSRPHSSNEKVTIGELEIDIAAHRIMLTNKEISLTKKEFELIMHLVQRNGRVQTREYLLSQIWGYTSDVTSRTVDTHIKRLRSKLGLFGKNIETVRSVGYRFNHKD